MLFWTTIKIAIMSILSNKLRSFLTMLGIIIGVGAVIAMLAIGNGAKEKITGNIKSLGSNILFIRPARFSRMGVSGGSRDSLKEEDLNTILSVEGVSMVSPETSGRYQIKFLGQNTNTQVVGIAPTFFEMRNYEIEKGRKFSDEDTLNRSKVAILGPDTADTLFEGRYPIGKKIKIKGIGFTVIGTTKSKGDIGFMNRDDVVYVPFLTMSMFLNGRDYYSTIDVSVKDENIIEKVKNNIETTLRKAHRLQENQENDFEIRDMTEILEKVGQTILIFKLLLGGVAGLSLLVGGIGIMNIMFVSVTERTKEIGIRKAIGARNADVLKQFLIEAVVLTVLGGIFGIFFGWGSIGLYNNLSPDTYFKGEIDLMSVLISVAFSVSVGLFFGFYPALKAARLNPIDALRYE